MAKTYWLDNSAGRQLATTDPADASDSVSVSNGGSTQQALYSEPVNNSVNRTSTGTFTVELNITTAASSTQARATIRRVNGVVIQASATSAYQSTATTGLKTFTFNNPALGTWNTNDFFEVVIEVQNNNAHGGAVTVAWSTGTANSEVSTPFSDPVTHNDSVSETATAADASSAAGDVEVALTEAASSTESVVPGLGVSGDMGETVSAAELTDAVRGASAQQGEGAPYWQPEISTGLNEFLSINADTDRKAQAFIGDGRRLKSITVWMADPNAGGGDPLSGAITARLIRGGSGTLGVDATPAGAVGSIGASNDHQASNLTTEYQPHTFYFDSEINNTADLIAGETYWIEIQSFAPSGAFFIKLAVKKPTVFTNLNAVAWDNSSVEWIPVTDRSISMLVVTSDAEDAPVSVRSAVADVAESAAAADALDAVAASVVSELVSAVAEADAVAVASAPVIESAAGAASPSAILAAVGNVQESGSAADASDAEQLTGGVLNEAADAGDVVVGENVTSSAIVESADKVTLAQFPFPNGGSTGYGDTVTKAARRVTGDGRLLHSETFYLYRDSGSTHTIRGALWASDGGSPPLPTGQPLAFSDETLGPLSLPTSFSAEILATFNFVQAQPLLTEGVEYFVGFEIAGPNDGTLIYVRSDVSSTPEGGAAYEGTSWVVAYDGVNFIFNPMAGAVYTAASITGDLYQLGVVAAAITEPASATDETSAQVSTTYAEATTATDSSDAEVVPGGVADEAATATDTVTATQSLLATVEEGAVGSTPPAKTGSTLTYGIDGLDIPGQSITVPADAKLALFFWSGWSSTFDISSVTLGGQAMTIAAKNAGTSSGSLSGHGVAYLVNPPVGTQTLDWAWTANPGEGPVVFVHFLRNVDTSNPIRDVALQRASGITAVSPAVVDSSEIDYVVALVEAYAGTPTSPQGTPVGSGQELDTDTFSFSARNGQLVKETVPGATSTTITMGRNSWSNITAISVRGVAGTPGASDATDAEIAAGVVSGDVSESATAADEQSVEIDFNAAQTESATATDTPDSTATTVAAAEENATPTDTVVSAGDGDVALEESASAADEPTAVAVAVAAQDESVTAADASTAVFDTDAALTESASAADSSSAAGDGEQSVSELVTADDAPTAVLITLADADESVTAAETQTGANTTAANQTEAGSAADEPTATADVVSAITETATATDSLDGDTDTVQSGTVLESLTAVAEEAATADRVAALAESVTTAESVVGALVTDADQEDAGAATETYNRSVLTDAVVAEDADAAEAADAVTAAVAALNEAAVPVDAQTVHHVQAAAFTESATAEDEAAAVATAVAAQAEAAVADDDLDFEGSAVASIDEDATADAAQTTTLDAVASLIEASTAADATTATADRVAAQDEAASADDAPVGASVLPTALAEAGSAQDATSGAAVLPVALTESAAAEDSTNFIVSTLSAEQDEAATATDELAGALVTSADAEEAITATDAQSVQADFVAESLALASAADQVDEDLDAIQSASMLEAGSADDALAATADFVAAATEAASAADAPDGVSVLPVALAEDADAQSAENRTLTTPAAQAESATAQADQDASVVFAGAVAEVTTAADQFPVTASMGMSVSEAANANDSLTATATFTAQALESVSAQERYNTGNDDQLDEAANATDTPSAAVNYALAITDAATAADQFAIDFTIAVATVDETGAADDAPDAQADFYPDQDEDADADDAPFGAYTTDADLAEAADALEAYTRGLSYLNPTPPIFVTLSAGGGDDIFVTKER